MAEDEFWDVEESRRQSRLREKSQDLLEESKSDAGKEQKRGGAVAEGWAGTTFENEVERGLAFRRRLKKTFRIDGEDNEEFDLLTEREVLSSRG